MITVTGATGFLGAHLLAALLRRDDRPVCALVRGDPETARDRLLRAVRSTGSRCEETDFRRRVTPVPVELTAPRLGLSAAEHSALAWRTQEVWHCAADTSPLGRAAALHRTNVEGTGRILELLAAGARGTRLFHISTAFVAGKRREGVVPEDALEERYGFATAYEESKFRAEESVRRWARDTGRAAVVFRPALLVTGRPAQPGEPRHWLAVQAARTSLLGQQDRALVLRAAGPAAEDLSFPYTARMPGRPDALVNLLQVDWAVAAMLRCATREAAGVETFHVTHPQDCSVQWLLRLALEPCDWLDIELDPELVPERMRPLERSLMRLAAGLTPHWWSRRRYDRTRLAAATAGLEPPGELTAEYVRAGMSDAVSAAPSPAGSARAGSVRKGAVNARV
ncbi:SDR family oxidoreductase [Streptomyces lydicus]|uniref:SDR family oxidoreductase n=1 Tax=Streptomyces lydicus TaxID=47763 RepID=UPI0028708FE3|nr:SDR family oxidoreductase [Streptomyces lydicus]